MIIGIISMRKFVQRSLAARPLDRLRLHKFAHAYETLLMAFNPFKGAFGLDIGDRTFKIVQLTEDPTPLKEQYKLNFYGSAAIPPECIIKGEILKAEPAIKILKDLLARVEKTGATRYAVASLPENLTFLKYLPWNENSLPPREKITELALEHLPIDAEEAYIDAQLIPKHKDFGSAGLIIGAVEKRIADSYTYFLEIAGITPIVFEFESVAVARALVKAREEENSNAICMLDIGATRTNLLIYDHEAVQISQSLGFSGEAMTEFYADAFQIDMSKAESKKKEIGINFKAEEKAKSKKILKELNFFAKKIEEILDYYQKEFSYARPVKEILLCGGGANTQELDKFLSSKLKMKAGAGNPWYNLFTKASAPFSEKELSSYATAIGLGLRAAYNVLYKDEKI